MESVTYNDPISQGSLLLKCKVQPGNLPGIAKPYRPREYEAYQALQSTPLKDFIPKLYGKDTHNDTEYIIISDITAGFETVCLADLTIGTRQSDIDTNEQVRDICLQTEHDTTSGSLGVRLTSATIRHGVPPEVVKEWTKTEGMEFNYDELQTVFDNFVPPDLKKAFSTKTDSIYQAYLDTLDTHSGFRMYTPSLIISYDGDRKDELRINLLGFNQTHINIQELGFDPNDDQYEDGVLQGLATLIDFANSSSNISPVEKGQLNITMIDENSKSVVRQCIVNPGNHKCIMRPANRNETEAITLLMSTPIATYLPRIFGIQNNQAIVEDITAKFESACLADFRIGSKSYDLDDKPDIEIMQRDIDLTTTTKDLQVRLMMAKRIQNRKLIKAWKPGETDAVNENEDALKQMVNEYADESMKETIAQQLVNLKLAYESTLETYPNLRMYDLSVLICYDGEDAKKDPICVFNRLARCHLDIQQEGYSTDAENDDGFIRGLLNLIALFCPEVAVKAESGKSKCCLLI